MAAHSSTFPPANRRLGCFRSTLALCTSCWMEALSMAPDLVVIMVGSVWDLNMSINKQSSIFGCWFESRSHRLFHCDSFAGAEGPGLAEQG